MIQFRKIVGVALVAGALFAGAVPAQAAATEDTPQASENFCQFVPRVCEALCIGTPDGRCKK